MASNFSPAKTDWKGQQSDRQKPHKHSCGGQPHCFLLLPHRGQPHSSGYLEEKWGGFVG